MLEVMFNALVLMLTLGLTFGSVLWKVFAKKPGQAARAIISTITATIGLLLFFGFVTYLTLVV